MSPSNLNSWKARGSQRMDWEPCLENLSSLKSLQHRSKMAWWVFFLMTCKSLTTLTWTKDTPSWQTMKASLRRWTISTVNSALSSTMRWFPKVIRSSSAGMSEKPSALTLFNKLLQRMLVMHLTRKSGIHSHMRRIWSGNSLHLTKNQSKINQKTILQAWVLTHKMNNP